MNPRERLARHVARGLDGAMDAGQVFEQLRHERALQQTFAAGYRDAAAHAYKRIAIAQ